MRDNFSDYIDDLMQIAANEIENRGLSDLYEKLRDLSEAARKKRE